MTITSLATSTVSWTVTHPGIDWALSCLTSVIGPWMVYLVNEAPREVLIEYVWYVSEGQIHAHCIIYTKCQQYDITKSV